MSKSTKTATPPKASRSARPKASTPADGAYDAIVIGGGHNGLTNAAYLAKSGLRTLVLERRHLVGGAAITEELRPGFWFTTFSYALSLLRPDIIHELDLVKHGFMPILMPTTFCPKEDGDYLLLGQDHGENLKEIARHSKRDADAYEAFNHDVGKVCQAIKPLLDMVPPDIFSNDPEELVALAALGSHFRGLDRKVLHDAVRLLTGSAADFLDDYFESDILKGYMASSAIIGTKVGPYSQGSGLVLLYHILGEHDAEFGAWAFHKQGNGGFTKVLARAAEALGVEIRLESPVERVITKNGRATGVALTDGTEVHAPVVVSALDPRRTFLELVEPRELPTDLVDAIERFRFQGTSAKVNFALDAVPRYPALGNRTDQYRGFTNIGPSMEYLERAFDDAKYGWYSKRPYLDCAIQSEVDPDMAPAGKAVWSSFVQYAPYHLRESDWDTERERLGDTVQATIESFFPGFGKLVLQREVRTPLDIERTVGLSEGNIFAGEFLAPQMFFFRPAPGWSQYRTPIHGYYQCGSGTHPGGCVMGAPGKLAAGQILKDRAAATRRVGRPLSGGWATGSVAADDAHRNATASAGWLFDEPVSIPLSDAGPGQAIPPGSRDRARSGMYEERTMSEAKVGKEFITHEFDEAIAIQQTIVQAERQLSEAHPEPSAKRSIKSSLRDDERFLKELKALGAEHGATGKVEEVAEGLQQLMQETAGKASEADSEAYEATAVLLNLKRKQQDSASAMLKIARDRKDTKLRDAAMDFHKATKSSAEDLAKELAAYAVKIAGQGQRASTATAPRR